MITISGRCRRTTSAIARRSGTPYSRMPSGRPRNSTVVDADDPRRLDLLGLADACGTRRAQPVDAGLAAGHHAVDDLLALPGPAGDRGGGAELQVVGVRDDAERALPVLAEGFPVAPCRRAWHGCAVPEIIDIVEIDPADETALRPTGRPSRRRSVPTGRTRCCGPGGAGQQRGRARALLPPHPAGRARRGSDHRVAEIGGAVQDNTHLADLEINVLPGRRREGIGRALYDDAMRRCGEPGRSTVAVSSRPDRRRARGCRAVRLRHGHGPRRGALRGPPGAVRCPSMTVMSRCCARQRRPRRPTTTSSRGAMTSSDCRSAASCGCSTSPNRSGR